MSKPLVIAIITSETREAGAGGFGPESAFGTAPTALLQGFAGMPGCEVHVISCLQQPVTPPAAMAANIHFHSLVIGKWGWLRGGYAGCILAIRKILREINPDIVHGQGTERYCSLAAVFSGFPNVVTIHGNMLAVGQALGAKTGSFYWWATKFETLALGKTAGVFCNSAYTEGLVAPRARKTWRVPNAVSDIYFGPLPAVPPQAAARPVIVNVGHVSSYKRQVELIDVARKLREAGLDFEMRFIGESKGHSAYQREFLACVKEAENKGYARWLGKIDAAGVVAVLDTADGMVHFPSEEAFGLAAAEGMSRNLKFFGSRAGGVVDIATGVEGAELIGVDDWDGLGDAIRRWLKNGAPRPVAAAAEMKARYLPSLIAGRHMEIYREVLGK